MNTMEMRYGFFSLWLIVLFGFFTVGLAQAQIVQHQSLKDQQKLEDQQEDQEKKEFQQKQQQQTANFQALEGQQQAELSGASAPNPNSIGGNNIVSQGVSHSGGKKHRKR